MDNYQIWCNGFYLPLMETHQSVRINLVNGNDWTPVNFGGSVELDKATGALPILNTTQGGTHATVGVRTDTTATSINSCKLGAVDLLVMEVFNNVVKRW